MGGTKNRTVIKHKKILIRKMAYSRKTFQNIRAFGNMQHLQIYISAETPKRLRSQDRHLYKMKMNIYARMRIMRCFAENAVLL